MMLVVEEVRRWKEEKQSTVHSAEKSKWRGHDTSGVHQNLGICREHLLLQTLAVDARTATRREAPRFEGEDASDECTTELQ